MAIAVPARPLVDLALPQNGAARLGAQIVLAVLGTLLLTLSAKTKVVLGPVDMSLQTLAVLLIGASFGFRLGVATLLLYLAEGAAGLPVFALGGGLSYFMGPTAGYLISYPIAAFLVGWLAERRWDRKLLTATVAMLLGNLVIYAIGMAWLGTYKGILFEVSTLVAGVQPFILGDLTKIAVAAVVLPSAWRIAGRDS